MWLAWLAGLIEGRFRKRLKDDRRKERKKTAAEAKKPDQYYYYVRGSTATYLRGTTRQRQREKGGRVKKTRQDARQDKIQDKRQRRKHLRDSSDMAKQSKKRQLPLQTVHTMGMGNGAMGQLGGKRRYIDRAAQTGHAACMFQHM